RGIIGETAVMNNPTFHPMPPPSVSVIVPTYNNAHFIAETLHSLFAQTFTDVEIIVIDDGSTDDTAIVLTAFLNRIKIVLQDNAGPAAARNHGLQLAQGEFVLFLDADDLLLPNTLAEQVAILKERPFLGATHSGWQIMDETGHVIKTVEPWHDAPQLDLLTWLQWKPVRLGATLFRRAWLEQVNGFDPTLRQAEDVDLMLRLSLAGCQIKWLPRPTMQYRHHAQSTIRQG
ncbi:MAG: glycosyltransferase, partial [Chloroflexi bacterium]|nr:glycosyltransferase [Chloroflexota bacterium]